MHADMTLADYVENKDFFVLTSLSRSHDRLEQYCLSAAISWLPSDLGKIKGNCYTYSAFSSKWYWDKKGEIVGPYGIPFESFTVSQEPDIWGFLWKEDQRKQGFYPSRMFTNCCNNKDIINPIESIESSFGLIHNLSKDEYQELESRDPDSPDIGWSKYYVKNKNVFVVFSDQFSPSRVILAVNGYKDYFDYKNINKNKI